MLDEATGFGLHSIHLPITGIAQAACLGDRGRRRRVVGPAVASRDLPDLFLSVCQRFLSADGGVTGVVITAVVITAVVRAGSLTSGQQQALF